MTLIEGMSYGCIPVTFSNYGAVFDIIDNGINGRLISAFNKDDYANRLSELIYNEEKRMEMSIEAIKDVKIFSVENVVENGSNCLN